MQPTLQAGDLLVVQRAAPARVGDLVVARLPDGTIAVKRAAYHAADGWWLERDADAGVDSWTVGAVAETAVQAVVRGRVWPRPRLFR
jgi:SOS-response transcriptional repressor LexA